MTKRGRLQVHRRDPGVGDARARSFTTTSPRTTTPASRSRRRARRARRTSSRSRRAAPGARRPGDDEDPINGKQGRAAAAAPRRRRRAAARRGGGRRRPEARARSHRGRRRHRLRLRHGHDRGQQHGQELLHRQRASSCSTPEIGFYVNPQLVDRQSPAASASRSARTSTATRRRAPRRPRCASATRSRRPARACASWARSARGVMRNTIKLDDAMTGMDTDIVAQGPLLVGARHRLHEDARRATSRSSPTSRRSPASRSIDKRSASPEAQHRLRRRLLARPRRSASARLQRIHEARDRARVIGGLDDRRRGACARRYASATARGCSDPYPARRARASRAPPARAPARTAAPRSP